jgi:hypothetical protein
LTDEDTMTKKRAHKTSASTQTPVPNLPPRNPDATRGGAAYTEAQLAQTMTQTTSDVIKSLGSALNTVARGG